MKALQRPCLITCAIVPMITVITGKLLSVNIFRELLSTVNSVIIWILIETVNKLGCAYNIITRDANSLS